MQQQQQQRWQHLHLVSITWLLKQELRKENCPSTNRITAAQVRGKDYIQNPVSGAVVVAVAVGESLHPRIVGICQDRLHKEINEPHHHHQQQQQQQQQQQRWR